MSLGVMSPYHPRWDEFLVLLNGPRGCNFREKIPGDANSVTWTCDNTLNRPIARRLLLSMGATEQEVEQSLGLFHGHGGMCDCEISFNVENSMRPERRPLMKRRPARKNPR